MLQLVNIIKDYPAGDGKVNALKGISLRFRKNEFVSILGPSGCGKTTMLNIIGGLDQYTSGDLVINGRSTKDFKDRDWDAYRNHSIGFVFQSYNLIPHQTVLQNVELALTLSGVSKLERRKRAKKALEDVGLGDQLKKKPGEMSGGQMQRVAIARALVNDPDIILADEPTGALDTETSVQVMDILKKISKDRLIIMVTHNPDLAQTYSTRIIRMLDGVITDDSDPMTEQEVERSVQQLPKTTGKKAKKPSMSMGTAFKLSFKNLFSKKGRTMLTSFAGSIGIIGIALITAVSNGMTAYINSVQEDTLSSYPLTLEAAHTDMGSLLTAFIGEATSHGEHGKDAVYQKTMLYDLINSLNNMSTSKNDLKAFKEFLDRELADTSEDNDLRDAINGVQYGYDLELLIYTKNVDGTILRSDTEKLLMELMIKYMGVDMSGMLSISESYGFGDMMTMGTPKLWQEILPGKNGELINPLLYSQYEIIDGGRWPAAYNEIVLVVDENNEIDDMTLYALGLKSEEDINALANAALNKENIEVEEKHWTYEEIRAMEFRTVFPFDCYTYDESTGLYTDMRVNKNGDENLLGLQYLYDNGLSLKVTGIIRPKEGATSTMLSGNIAYTSALTAHIIEQGKKAPVIQAQMANPDVDVTTGLPFKPTSNTITAQQFGGYLATLDDAVKAQVWVAYISVISPEALAEIVDPKVEATPIEQMRAMLAAISAQMDPQTAAMLAGLDDAGVRAYYRTILETQETAKYAMMKQMECAQKTAEELAAELKAAQDSLADEERMALYKAAEFVLYVQKLDENGKANAYIEILVADKMEAMIEQINKMSREDLVAYIEKMLTSGNLEVPGDYNQYVEQLLQKDEKSLKETCISLIKSDVMQTEKTTRAEVLQSLAAQGLSDPAAQAAALVQAMDTYTVAQFVTYYDNVLAFSEATYEEVLVKLGSLDLESPSSINIYASSFENKEIIEAAIENYNKDKDELQRIVYTDYIGIMLSSITTIINAITYVLIAFVAISLVVSSIMIGVITLISVQERTKEIGILRAIGASKKNVSSMFIAETAMIGLTSGLLGVLVTYLLCIPINAIINFLTGIPNLDAVLPIPAAVILVCISIGLTLISGLIPSRSAAKKDPVVALRTE